MNMTRIAAAALGLVVTLSAPRQSLAGVWISIADASQVTYLTSADGKVYFRNLNVFNSNALGCCNNYYIDTTAQEGKNIYALFLSLTAQAKGFSIELPDGYAAGMLTNAGEL